MNYQVASEIGQHLDNIKNYEIDQEIVQPSTLGVPMSQGDNINWEKSQILKSKATQ